MIQHKRLKGRRVNADVREREAVDEVLHLPQR